MGAVPSYYEDPTTFFDKYIKQYGPNPHAHLDNLEWLIWSAWNELFEEIHSKIPHLSPREHEWLDEELKRDPNRVFDTPEYSVSEIEDFVHKMLSFLRYLEEWEEHKADFTEAGFDTNRIWFTIGRVLRYHSHTFNVHLPKLKDSGYLDSDELLSNLPGWKDARFGPQPWFLEDKAGELHSYFNECRFSKENEN